ncbi:hypothetical protein Nepgr_004147 [Nepenthes gracilis]|uniref:Uncharacterized protein n=1 Tax=Nepenthes gracilis TaxID=150966 RepID=A0AAD3XER1_NEPGR|nr:hypothetical protein Nepgr_004147 [Nepenthes gracilis]
MAYSPHNRRGTIQLSFGIFPPLAPPLGVEADTHIHCMDTHIHCMEKENPSALLHIMKKAVRRPHLELLKPDIEPSVCLEFQCRDKRCIQEFGATQELMSTLVWQ